MAAPLGRPRKYSKDESTACSPPGVGAWCSHGGWRAGPTGLRFPGVMAAPSEFTCSSPPPSPHSQNVAVFGKGGDQDEVMAMGASPYDCVPITRADMDTFTHRDGEPCVELEAESQAMSLRRGCVGLLSPRPLLSFLFLPRLHCGSGSSRPLSCPVWVGGHWMRGGVCLGLSQSPHPWSGPPLRMQD